jgi:hypothetical protein
MTGAYRLCYLFIKTGNNQEKRNRRKKIQGALAEKVDVLKVGAIHAGYKDLPKYSIISSGLMNE